MILCGGIIFKIGIIYLGQYCEPLVHIISFPKTHTFSIVMQVRGKINDKSCCYGYHDTCKDIKPDFPPDIKTALSPCLSFSLSFQTGVLQLFPMSDFSFRITFRFFKTAGQDQFVHISPGIGKDFRNPCIVKPGGLVFQSVCPMPHFKFMPGRLYQLSLIYPGG